MIPKSIKRIPYGVADFEKIQCDNLYYVDKTKLIPLFESLSYYTFLIRPRRFGKSLWVSVLENYYDINTKDRFKEIFKNTWISQNPTDEKDSYLILTFNFSMINPDIRFIDESFEANGSAVIRDFLERYTGFFTGKEQEQVYGLGNTADQLREIFFLAFRKGLKIFLIIDEYDNFANTILATSGNRAYQELTRGPGFFRYFFNIFKGGTSRKNAGLSRMFITGVSPITMDDVTSGFNIGRNISLERKLNEFLGFTHDDVKAMLNYYKNQGLLSTEKEADKGFCDFWLEPFLAKFPDLPFAYLIELKYISREKFTDALLKTKIDQAEKQLEKYGRDKQVMKFSGKVAIKKLVLVYNGWELVYSGEI